MTDYLVHSEEDRKKILKYLGIEDPKKLFDFVPKKILKPCINISEGLNEKDEKIQAGDVYCLDWYFCFKKL